MRFRDIRTNQLFVENSHPDGDCYYFTVPLHVALNTSDPFHTFLASMMPIQAYAVSEDLSIFMCVKPVIKFNRQMFQAMFTVNQSVTVDRVRAYVELQDTTGEIVHPTEQRSLKALHTGGRDGALNWEQLQAAVGQYGLSAIVLDSEVSAYMAANGYNY